MTSDFLGVVRAIVMLVLTFVGFMALMAVIGLSLSMLFEYHINEFVTAVIVAGSCVGGLLLLCFAPNIASRLHFGSGERVKKGGFMPNEHKVKRHKHGRLSKEDLEKLKFNTYE